MFFKSFLLLLLLNLFIGAIEGDDDGTQCTTPDSQEGDCVEVTECEKIKGVVTKIKSGLIKGEMREKAVNVLKKYICGRNNGSVQFCCPRPTKTSEAPTKIPEIGGRFLLPESCGNFDYGDKVANGTSTTLMEFPWMALLGYDINGRYKFECGGSLINNRYVLTAAHCIKPNLRMVRLGENDLRSTIDCYTPPGGDEICAEPVQNIRIAKTIIHPNFNRILFSSDIALIRLRRQVDISVESVRPICLPLTKKLQSKALKHLVLTGWGITDTRRSRPSDNLMKVNVAVKPLDECRNIYHRQFNVTEEHLCIGGDLANGSCSGDSGGPLQYIDEVNSDVKYVQFGVISLGPQNCGRAEPGVHVKLSHYIDWILKTIEP